MKQQMANSLASKQASKQASIGHLRLFVNPFLIKTVDGRIFFCLFDGFSFFCGEVVPA